MSAAPRTGHTLRLVASTAANTDGAHAAPSFWERRPPVLRLVRGSVANESVLTPALEAECRALEAQSPTAWPPGWPTGLALSRQLRARLGAR